MNEQVKLLAEQANIRFGRMAILDGDPRGMARYVTYSEFEKFAELIVRECIDIVEHSRIEDDESVCLVGATKCKIKHHFGVE
jgi:hypothetical protein